MSEEEVFKMDEEIEVENKKTKPKKPKKELSEERKAQLRKPTRGREKKST